VIEFLARFGIKTLQVFSFGALGLDLQQWGNAARKEWRELFNRYATAGATKSSAASNGDA